MNATSSELALIIDNLSTIKYCVIALLVLMGVVAFINLARSIYFMRNEIRKLKKDVFSADNVSELIEKNEIGKAKELSLQKLNAYPNHSHAQFYLAKVYYIEKEYDKCRELLVKLLETEPMWNDKYVKPILKQLDEVENEQQE